MTIEEAAQLLTKIAGIDNRNFGKSTIREWWLLFGGAGPDGIPFADACTAVDQHRITSTEYLMPVHVIQGVKRIRRDRLERSLTAPPPAEDAVYRPQLRAQITAIADGRSVNRVLGLPPGSRRPDDPPEGYQAERARLQDMTEEQSLEARAAMAVRCPYCGALPGSACENNASGKPLASGAHPGRIDLAAPVNINDLETT